MPRLRLPGFRVPAVSVSASKRSASDAWAGLCPVCGKHRFATRKAAKAAARARYPGEALRAYRCGSYWHMGHTPRWIVRGDKD
jgi:hypothetical protein